ncbi:MAG: molybdate ABC transporter substrate-binding protein [Pseudomonadota bacterium]
MMHHAVAVASPLARRLYVVCAVMAFALTGVAQAGEARVAVASNFAPTLDALIRGFERHTDHTIAVSSGSTGKLYAQIVNGAPFDIFLAGDAARPARLDEDGLAVAGSRFTYAVGRLVLWDPAGGGVSADRLRYGEDRVIAMANPKLAPYGAAADQVLEGLGVTKNKKPKRVYGEDVGQTFAFIHTGNAPVGFIALAQILTLPESQRGTHWAPDAGDYAPIRQDGVLLQSADGNAAATAFLAFLKSGEARAIIAEAGYDIP